MALVLNFKTGAGFLIDGTRFVVESITDNRVAMVHNTVSNERFRTSDKKKTMIHPGVYVQVGAVDAASFTRLAFSAPRAITILREELVGRVQA